MTSFDISEYDEVLSLGKQYESARDALLFAQHQIREWCYKHPDAALNAGLLKIDYSKATKMSYRR